MNNVIRMVPQHLINEVLWLQEQAMKARARGQHRVADTWLENSYALMREIGGFDD